MPLRLTYPYVIYSHAICADCVTNNYMQECEGARNLYEASVSFRPSYPLHISAHGLPFFLVMSYC